MKNLKNITASLLCLAIMAVSVVSCAEQAEKPSNEIITTEPAETENDIEEEDEGDSLQKRQKVSDKLPEITFGGDDFNIIVQKEFEYDAGVEEETGDALEDAIYNRNARINERFDIKINCTAEPYSDVSSKVSKTVKSGDDAYDLVMNHIIQTGGDAIKGMYRNWADFSYVDTSDPWYSQYAIGDCTVNGKLYVIVSDATISSYEQTYCVYFNRTIASDYNIESSDFYSLVRNKEWTIDKLSEYTAMVYEDINGNGKADKADKFGNKTLLFYSFNSLWAFEQPILEISADDYEIVLNTEKTVSILDKLYDFYYNNKGTFIINDYQEVKNRFAAGESLFLMCHFYPALHELRSMEQDYGIIPYPKWDDAQENYKTTIDGSFDVLAAPMSIPDENVDYVGIITQAIAADSWKNVQPVFYDIALKVKGTRDEESIEMIDTILNARTVDFSWLYCGWDGFNFIISDMLSNKKGGDSFSSYYEKNLKKATRAYDKAFGYFFED